jgi:hypothetical protein
MHSHMKVHHPDEYADYLLQEAKDEKDKVWITLELSNQTKSNQNLLILDRIYWMKIKFTCTDN